MKPRLFVLVLCFSAAAPSPTGMAQPLESVEARSTAQGAAIAAIPLGSRIRVTAPQVLRSTTVGTLNSWSTDSLELGFERPPLSLLVPLTSIKKLEVSVGPRPVLARIARGAVIGALLGAAFTLAVQVAETSENTKGEEGLALAWGAVVGAPVGLIVGAASRPERWTDRPIGAEGSRALEK